jgi:superfamily I DNA and/or RNA helicase
MAILYLDALPPKTTKGTIVRLLQQVGQIDRLKIGAIELKGRSATVEVPWQWTVRLVKALDGASVGTQFIRATASGGSSGGGPADHFSRMLRLLELEGEAEAELVLRNQRRRDRSGAEAAGTALLGLAVRGEHLGLGTRVLVTFGKRDTSRPLPWTRLAVGTPVLISDQRNDGQSWRGVVSDLSLQTIEVALAAGWNVGDSGEESSRGSGPPQFRLDLSSDEVSRQRQRAALQRVRDAGGDRLAALRAVLLGEQAARFSRPAAIAPLNPQLNESQRQAVEFALTAEDVAVIHGPPGTGKTTAIVELIRQAVQRGEKVLACAPSNLAVDNLLERLVAAGERVVRLGHPARVLEELREHTLDLIVDRQADVKLARKLVRDAQVLRDRAARFTRAKPAPGARQELREEARQLIADARRMESQVVQQVLDQAHVLCATTTGLDSEILGQRQFDLAVIDEACQSTEPGCWLPVLRCQRLVLAGDHCQLPPTVISDEAAREGFAVSLLERLIALDAPGLSRRLIIQYRMHEQIMEFSSREFYDGSLVADDAVRRHELTGLPGVAASELTQKPLEFVDTAGASYDEQEEPDGDSRWNEQEATLVARFVRALLDAAIPAADIGVISPYAAQVRHLREKMALPGLEIDTVDGFQGREKEVIVVSLVRSNPHGEIGFLADVRRMNVALTRARRKLIVVGDSATIAHHPFYKRWLEFVERSGAYRTVWEVDGG